MRVRVHVRVCVCVTVKGTRRQFAMKLARTNARTQPSTRKHTPRPLVRGEEGGQIGVGWSGVLGNVGGGGVGVEISKDMSARTDRQTALHIGIN